MSEADDLVVIYAGNILEADLVKSLLEADGIAALFLIDANRFS